MNNEMSYLLGLICGNGEIKRGQTDTTVSIEIPHKKLETEQNHDVRIYVRASITDFRTILEPLIGAGLSFTQQDNYSVISFTKPNTDYLTREIMRYIGNASSHEDIRIADDIFSFTHDERISFLRGFADVTGYIRRSNYYFDKYKHRVYIEVPHNWGLVADVCNLLKSVDVPVQAIDWAHPNIRDGNLTKFNQGLPNFWKKEHQIKIWANEFEPIGFAVIHKKEALGVFAKELVDGVTAEGKNVADVTHRFYWENRVRNRARPHHPSEDDPIIPLSIRGKHYDSWKEIAFDLGYKE
jgi:hypothetical protein